MAGDGNVYTAKMGNPPIDDDMMSNEKLRRAKGAVAEGISEAAQSAAGMAGRGLASGMAAGRAAKEALKAGASSGIGSGAAGVKAPMPPSRGGRISDADVFTADKIRPGMDLGALEPDSMTAPPVRPTGERQKKAAKDIRAAMGMKKGGSVSSASKRADGIATKGKTKGRIV